MNNYDLNIISNNNIDYFLFTKKIYDTILKNLNETIYFYNQLREYNKGYLTICENSKHKVIEQNLCNSNIISLEKEIKKYENDIIILKEKLCIINKNIQHTCCHEFIEDYIDINPDRSEKIIYCQVCEYTKLF